MVGIKNRIIDVYDDGEFALLKSDYANIPGFVKTAEYGDKHQKNDFALTLITENGEELNKFPIDTKEDAFLSDYYFKKTAALLPPPARDIAAFYINKSLIKHGLLKTADAATFLAEPDDNKYYMSGADRDFAEEYMKQAAIEDKKILTEQLSDDNYALVKTSGEQKIKKFPIYNSELIKKACDYFTKQYKKHDVSERAEIAEKILAKTAAVKTTFIPEKVLLYSGNAEPRKFSDIKTAFELRKKFSSNPAYDNHYNQLLTKVGRENPKKLAKVLYEIDKRANNTKHYDSYFSDPYETFFKGFEKNAAFIAYGINNKTLTDEKLNELVYGGKMNHIFSDEILKKFKENPRDAFLNLSSEEKNIIFNLLD